MNMIIKVADFGLSVKTGTTDYCRLTGDMGTKLLVMWMAPESLSDCVFSEKSDVVSEGLNNHTTIIELVKVPSMALYAVELWSDMLGDIHRRSSTLCWY